MSATTGGGSGPASTPSLDVELQAALKSWRRGVRMYGTVYYASRLVLIVSSALVASSTAFLKFARDDVIAWNLSLTFQILSVVVAVLAALDTWLKPLQKWQGFMESRDALSDLLARIEIGLAADEAREKFLLIRQRHRDLNIF